MPRKKVKLPLEGEAFAVPLADGRYSVCRVLLDADSAAAQQWKSPYVLVACSAWIGDTIPQADDPSLRPILRLTHHSWKGQREVLWISDPVPELFVPIGSIPPTSKEKSLKCNSFGGWPSLSIQPLAQWRWDHERDAVLVDDQAKKTQEEAKRQQSQQQRADYLAGLTLEKLRERCFFPQWKRNPPKKAITASREVMSSTVEQLIELGPRASKKARMAILQDCIERFNALDTKLGNFISTIEREDICDEFEGIVHACGLGDHADLADKWREW